MNYLIISYFTLIVLMSTKIKSSSLGGSFSGVIGSKVDLPSRKAKQIKENTQAKKQNKEEKPTS